MAAKLPRLLPLLTFLLVSLPGGGQTPAPRTPAPAVSPTGVVPPAAMTPGSGVLTPGPGPIYGKTDLYGIPPTTPVGMPAYTITSAGPAVAPTAAEMRPVSASDCAGEGWRKYPALAFASRANCESWVVQHPSGSPVGTPSGVRGGTAAKNVTPRRTTPRPRAGAAPAPTATPAAR